MENQFTISGTEIGAILGLSPYMTPMDLYMRKLGLIDPPTENEAMKWGIAAEHVVARRYAKETGFNLYPETDKGYDYKTPMTHPKYDWWTGTPDRLINTEPFGLLEIKIVGERMAPQWGDPPDGDVPEQYLTQCAWYMPLLGVEWADLAVQIGNRDYRVYRITRDRELENQLRDAALAFINDHLIPAVPPPIDGSESSKRYLNYRYPQDSGPMLETDNPGVIECIRGLKEVDRQMKIWEDLKGKLTNDLKSVIGDSAGLQGTWGKIYWKKNKDSQKTDWERAFREIAAEHDPEIGKAIILNHTIIKPGARVFRPYFKEED